MITVLVTVVSLSAKGYAVLVGYWPLADDVGGPSGTTTSVTDASGHGNSGTISGLGSTIFWDGSGSGHTGMAGDNSLEFTVQEDAHVVDIPHSSSLNITGKGLTLSLWVETVATVPQT